jgi:transposase-like protein
MSFLPLGLSPSEACVLGRKGWVFYTPGEIDEGVFLRLARDSPGKRLKVVEVRAGGPDGLSARTLRELPVARIEAAANNPREAWRVNQAIKDGPPFDMSEPYAGLSSAFFRDPSRVARRQRTLRQLKLRIPKTARKSDAFYSRVANAYSSEVSMGNRQPAADIATANDVPVTTVHRWIKEARRRGLLAKGEQGKAG